MRNIVFGLAIVIACALSTEAVAIGYIVVPPHRHYVPPKKAHSQPPQLLPKGQSFDPCWFADNFAEYKVCRLPKLAAQTMVPASHHQQGSDEPYWTTECAVDNGCDFEKILGIEWRGILRFRGVKQK